MTSTEELNDLVASMMRNGLLDELNRDGSFIQALYRGGKQIPKKKKVLPRNIRSKYDGKVPPIHEMLYKNSVEEK
jgi:hypothetical protein